MEIGVSLRLMGDSATREIVRGCAVRAEQAGLDALWVPDHVDVQFDVLGTGFNTSFHRFWVVQVDHALAVDCPFSRHDLMQLERASGSVL